MPCGCSKKKKYEVVTSDGKKQIVDTLTAAMQIIRREGGHYQAVKV